MERSHSKSSVVFFNPNHPNRVWVNGVPITLTPKEYELLYLLLLNRGRCVSYNLIIKELWRGQEQYRDQIAFQRHVLVKKLVAVHPPAVNWIRTIRSAGLMLDLNANDVFIKKLIKVKVLKKTA